MEELHSTIISAILSDIRYENIKEVKYLSTRITLTSNLRTNALFDCEIEAFEDKVDNIVFNLKAIEEHISTHLNIYPLFNNISDKSDFYYPIKVHVQTNRIFGY